MPDKPRPDSRVRALLLIAIGVLLGLVMPIVLSHAFPSKPRRYILTSDLDADQVYFFKRTPDSAPVRGTLLAGTEFEIDMRKSTACYIALRTVVDARDLATHSKPLAGSEPIVE